MSLYETYSRLDDDDMHHCGRVLVLLEAFAGGDGTGTIDGLTKLAKLDFLLRYPLFLERALAARGASGTQAHVADHERKSVESSMMRYKYGPWDPRHRRIVNLLVARGLAGVQTEGRTIKIGLSARGGELARVLGASEAYADANRRAAILKRKFDLSATGLKNFVYQTFPEIETMRLGEEIPP